MITLQVYCVDLPKNSFGIRVNENAKFQLNWRGGNFSILVDNFPPPKKKSCIITRIGHSAEVNNFPLLVDNFPPWWHFFRHPDLRVCQILAQMKEVEHSAEVKNFPLVEKLSTFVKLFFRYLDLSVCYYAFAKFHPKWNEWKFFHLGGWKIFHFQKLPHKKKFIPKSHEL